MTDRIDEIVTKVMGWHQHEAPPLKWKDWRALVIAGIEAAARQDEETAQKRRLQARKADTHGDADIDFDQTRKAEILELSAARHRSLISEPGREDTNA